jgi:hypothetical protein
VCSDCSQYRLGGRRACTLCAASARSGGRRVSRSASSSLSATPAGSAAATPAREGLRLQARLRSLEGKLMQLEEARREAGAAALLRCADALLLSVVVGVLLSGLVLGRLCAQWFVRGGAEPLVLAFLEAHMGTVRVWGGPAAEGWLRGVQWPWVAWGVGPLAALCVLSSLWFRRSASAFSMAAVLMVGFELTKVKARRGLQKNADQVSHHPCMGNDLDDVGCGWV